MCITRARGSIVRSHAKVSSHDRRGYSRLAHPARPPDRFARFAEESPQTEEQSHPFLSRARCESSGGRWLPRFAIGGMSCRFANRSHQTKGQRCMKRFQQPRFGENLFYHPVEAPLCPECHQPVHPHKFTRKEKVEAMKDSTQDIGGVCVLTMPDGVKHSVPTERLISLLNKVQAATGSRSGGSLAPWLFHKYPILSWLKDSTFLESTDGSTVHQSLLDLIRGKQEERKAS